MTPRNFRPVESNASGVAGGLILLAMAAAAWFVVQLGRSWQAERTRQWAVAWVEPGSVDAGHQIKLDGALVGKVVEVGFPERRLGLDVVAAADPARTDGTHLGVGQQSVVRTGGDSLVVRLESLRRARIVWADWSLALDWVDSLARWRLDSTGHAPFEATGEWRALERCPASSARCLTRGGTLRFGDATLHWRGIRQVVRVLVELDRTAIEEATAPAVAQADTFRAEPERLVGMELRQTGAFGIGKQGLKLVLPGRNPELLAARPVVIPVKTYQAPLRWFIRSDSQPAVELLSADGFDLAAVTAMLDYLNDPALRDIEPRTRWEDIIDGTRGTIAGARGAVDGAGGAIGSARASLDQIRRVAAVEDGQGMVSRLLFEAAQQRRFKDAIDTLPVLLAQVERLAGTADVTLDSTGRSIRGLATRIDSTLDAVEPALIAALEGARTLEDSLVALSKGLENALASVKKTGKPIGIALLVKLLASTLLDVAKLTGLR